MALPLLALAFFSALGVLAITYTLHFRRRALSMGPERLRAALSRTTGAGEDAGPLELRQGVSELEARLRRALYAVCGLLVAVLTLCLVLTVMSALPEVSLALSGFCVLLASLYVSIILLREIPRSIAADLDRELRSG